MPGEMPLGEELVDEEDAKGGEGVGFWIFSPNQAGTGKKNPEKTT